MMSAGSSGKGGNSPACAVCKFRRWKCSNDCPLAPYFPVSKTKDFENVHRLFGVSNITKTIFELKTKAERDDYIKSIIAEAHIRTLWPVHGCTAVIADLFRQLENANQELHRTQRLLHALKPQMQEFGSSINDVTTTMYMWDENAAHLSRQLMIMPNNPGQEIISESGQEMESNALAGQEMEPQCVFGSPAESEDENEALPYLTSFSGEIDHDF